MQLDHENGRHNDDAKVGTAADQMDAEPARRAAARTNQRTVPSIEQLLSGEARLPGDLSPIERYRLRQQLALHIIEKPESRASVLRLARIARFHGALLGDLQRAGVAATDTGTLPSRHNQAPKARVR